MKPTPITKKQFINWFIVFTIGMAIWASPLWGIGVGVLTFGNLILMPLRERSRPLPAHEVLWMFAGLAVFVMLMFASKRWLPSDFGEPVARVLRHPAVVAIIWAFVSWLTYRRYKATSADAYNAA